MKVGRELLVKKITVIGLFCSGEGVSNGQSVKTRIVSEELEKVLGKQNVYRIDTFNWKKNPFRLFAKCVVAVNTSSNVLFLTDEGGIRVFPWLLRLANFGGKCRIHYYVVGGWLNNYLSCSKKAVSSLKKLHAIYVEIPAMLRELEDRGFENVVLVNKFRSITPISPDDLDMSPSAPYKLCYFSRVMREKGVEECIEAVKKANKQAGFEKYSLDIFGSINESYRETFEEKMKKFPPVVNYRGIVDFCESGQVLKDYFAMLFPTYYTSEGYPNAVVDAFAAGLPVIATRWNYNSDIIRDHVDGLLVDVKNVNQIIDAVEELSDNPDLYEVMRRNCVARCKEYLPENAISKVIKELKM